MKSKNNIYKSGKIKKKKKNKQLSSLSACKVTLWSNKQSSPTFSSSHANNLRLHFHGSPFSPHPNWNISNTDTHLSTDSSNNMLNLSLRDTPPIHTSDQKLVCFPSPTNLPTWLPNYDSLRKAAIARHQAEPDPSPSNNLHILIFIMYLNYLLLMTWKMNQPTHIDTTLRRH